VAKYEQIYDKGSDKVDWDNVYRKEYGKYVKTSKFAWEQSGNGGGSERIFRKVEESGEEREREFNPETDTAP